MTEGSSVSKKLAKLFQWKEGSARQCLCKMLEPSSDTTVILLCRQITIIYYTLKLDVKKIYYVECMSHNGINIIQVCMYLTVCTILVPISKG